MSRSPTETIPAVKYEVTVQENGRIDLAVPFSPGKRVVVFVVEVPNLDNTFADLTDAAQSSTDFWDNPYDDEDWNHA